jgi:hypothetical protein
MTKKKNIQASNQNVYSTEDGILNSMNDTNNGGNVTKNFQNEFDAKKNPGIQPGAADTKNKR